MLDALIAEQARLELTDKEFAALLGLYRTTWNRIRHQHYPLPPRTVQRAVQAFPGLHPDATLFLLGSENKVTTVAHQRRKRTPSNIDLPASEASHTVVTLACAHTETALPGQGEGGSSSVQSVPRTARKGYVMSRYDASALASRAADAEAG